MTASKACVNRLQKEYKALLKEPCPGIKAHPNPNNILEWHYVIEGQRSSDFEGGVYHGKLLFHPQYPFKAPGIMMLTPNGRFTTGQRLCLSMSDFHPESWNPLWSVGTILTGLASFMYEDAITTGAIRTSGSERKRLAASSLETNLRDANFKKIFPEYAQVFQDRKESQRQQGLTSQRQPASATPAASRGRSWSSFFLIASVLAVTASIIAIPLTSS